eukprot:gene24429-biopygen5920
MGRGENNRVPPKHGLCPRRKTNTKNKNRERDSPATSAPPLVPATGGGEVAPWATPLAPPGFKTKPERGMGKYDGNAKSRKSATGLCCRGQISPSGACSLWRLWRHIATCAGVVLAFRGHAWSWRVRGSGLAWSEPQNMSPQGLVFFPSGQNP